MPIEFTPTEARVLGSLMEKSVLTPDQYPLTLNALTNACNQKSSRDPVMALDPGEVQRAARTLQDKHVVRVEENFRSQVQKYQHRFCNTPFSDYQWDEAQFAIICVLMLRGARTPGELRANSGRLHTFADNQAVVDALTDLTIEPGAVVVKLPRAPGRKDPEYAHLFCGAVDTTPRPESVRAPAEPSGPSLRERVDTLEQELAELRRRLEAIENR